MSNSQKGRVLTLVVEFTEDTYPQWILDAHMNAPQNGVKVTSIAEGNKIKELEELEFANGELDSAFQSFRDRYE